MISSQDHMGKMSRKMAVFRITVIFPQLPMKVASLKAARAASTGQRMKMASDFGCLFMSPLIGD